MKSFTGKGRARTSLAVVLALALVVVAALPMIAGAAVPVTSVTLKNADNQTIAQPIMMWSTTGNALPNSVMLKAAVAPATESQAVTWEVVGAEEGITVSSTGVITATMPGDYKVIARSVQQDTVTSLPVAVHVDGPAATKGIIKQVVAKGDRPGVYKGYDVKYSVVAEFPYQELPAAALPLEIEGLANNPAGSAYSGNLTRDYFINGYAPGVVLSFEPDVVTRGLAGIGKDVSLTIAPTSPLPAGFTVEKATFVIDAYVAAAKVSGTFPAAIAAGAKSALVDLKVVAADGGLPTDGADGLAGSLQVVNNWPFPPQQVMNYSIDVDAVSALANDAVLNEGSVPAGKVAYVRSLDKFVAGANVVAGDAIFRITFNGGMEMFVTVKVSPAPGNPASVIISLDPSTVQVGKTSKATAVVTNVDNAHPAPAATFASSNTAVATVAADGTITAVAPGTAVITARSQNGAVIKEAVATLTVVAAPAVAKDVLTKPYLSVATPKAGKSFFVRGYITPAKKAGTAPALAKIQVKVGTSYKTVRSIKMAAFDSTGKSILRGITSLPKGTYRVRTVNASTTVPAVSPWLTFSVK